MIVAGFDWDGGNRRKCAKHGVSIRAIEELFAGEMTVFPDAGHSRAEERLKAIGKTRAGRHVFVPTLTPADHDRLAELRIPLITPSQEFPGELGEITQRLLASEGVEQRQFRLKKLEKTFFGKGLRPALMAPAGLKSSGGSDELNRGRQKLALSFELPKGSYATVLLKRLFHPPA